MGAVLGGLFWWFVGKLFGVVRQADLEDRISDLHKENIEVKAENKDLKLQIEQERIKEKERREWEEASGEDEGTDILLRRFNNNKPN